MRNVVGGDLVADLSRGLDDGLDHRGVSNGADRGKGSRGDNWGSSVGESGVTNNDSRVSLSIPLHNSVGKGQSVAKTVVASVSHSGNSRGSNDWMVDHRAHRGVVDQRGGGGEDSGASSDDGGVSLSLPLAIVAEAVVANGHGNSVCSNFMADLGRSHLNRLDDRVAGNSTNGGKAESCGSCDHRGSGVRESGENLRVGLRGGRGRSNNC